MAEDTEHSTKLKDIEEKQNKYFARRVEAHDAEQKEDSNAQDIAEANGDADPGFAADFLCYECTPSEDELATVVEDQKTSTVVSKGGDR